MSTEVNTALGTWSELFMLLAALVYLCVFICFAWDMASHSKTLSEAEKRTAATSWGEGLADPGRPRSRRTITVLTTAATTLADPTASARRQGWRSLSQATLRGHAC